MLCSGTIPFSDKVWTASIPARTPRQLSENTVRKYVAGLEEKGLIRTEPSTITTKDGRVRNGSLIYTIRPIQEALELNYQRQFLQAERDMERAQAEKRLVELNQQNKKEESA